MARFSEEEIKKISDDLNASRIDSLLQWNKSGVVLKVEILASDNSCENCKSQNGKVYSIRDAIRNRPLPCKNCDNENYGFCRCCYLPIVE